MALLSSIQAVEGTTVPKTTTTTATAPTASYVTSTSLRSGTKSDEVKYLQQALATGGYYTGAIDGSFGPMTLAAVKAYQTKMGLTVDGIAGPQTLGSLNLTQSGSTQGTAPAPIVANPAIAPLEPIVKPKAVEEGQITDAGTSQTAPLQNAYLPQTTPIQPTPTVAPAQPTATPTGTQQTTQQPYVAPVTVQQGAGSMTPTVTPTTGTQVTTGGTGTAGSGTASTGTGTAGQPYQEQVNPYLEQLTQMQFQYSPFQDPEYLRRASDYEAQVAGMMVGRGGLWSSVSSAALRNGLLVMQQDMTKQKYEEFLQNRNFMFQMAQFQADENQRSFSNYMDVQQFQFAKDKEAFSQYAWQEEMNFSRSKEAFDQKMAIASYNLQAASLRFNQEMARQELAAAQEAAKYDALIKLAETDLAGAQKVVLTSQVAYEKDEKAYYSMLTKWRTSGTADKYVGNYFGVSPGSNISTPISMQKILDKASYLDQYKAELGIVADSLAMDANTLFQIQDFNKTTTGGSVRMAQ